MNAPAERPPAVRSAVRSGRERVLIGLVASLAAIAFVESYQGLYHAARAGGRPMPWLWPCAVEGFTLAMNVAIWDARSRGRRAPWAWVLLVLATGVSTALQVLDVLSVPVPALQDAVAAQGAAASQHAHTALGVLTAAWTPLALLLSFERWMWLAYGGHRADTADGTVAQDADDGFGLAHAQDEDSRHRDASRGPVRPSSLPPSPSSLPARPPSWSSPSSGASSQRHTRTATRPAAQDERALLERARRIAAGHLAASGRPIGRDALRRELRVSNRQASELLRQLRATPVLTPVSGDEDGHRQNAAQVMARTGTGTTARRGHSAPPSSPSSAVEADSRLTGPPPDRPEQDEDGPRPAVSPGVMDNGHRHRPGPVDPAMLVPLPAQDPDGQVSDG